MKLTAASLAPTCTSDASDHSIDRAIMFKQGKNLGTSSTCASVTSDHSADRAIMFNLRESSASLLIESHLRAPVCSDVLKEPVSADRCYYVTSDFVEVAALGRPLDLGMLYDCRNDSFNSDVFMWDASIVSSMRLSLPRPHTDVRILEGDSLQDRLGALDLTTPLRASVVSGLVEVAGAAAFLKHPTQSQLQDRVTLHHRTSTRLDMLSHRLLQNGAPLSVTSQNSATHVVVAVLYGAQAFFVFDHETESSEASRELKATVSKIITCSSTTDLLSSISEGEQALYTCALYADGEGIKNPVDFKTAVKWFRSHQRLFVPQREKEVPLKVWLLPLQDLTEASAPVLKEMSGDLLHKVETVLEYLNFLKKELGICTDMMSDCSSLHGITWFVALKDTLSKYSLLLKQYGASFRRGLASSITAMREKGEEGEESLRELLRKNDRSPFGPQNMYRWLQNKDAEVRALIECRAANVITVKSAGDLEHIIRHTQAERALCFTLTSLEGEDWFLSALKRHIDFLDMDNIQETPPAFRLLNVSQKIMSDLRSFLFAREAAECEEKTEFLAASAPEERFPGSCIRLYHTGMIVSDNLKIDAKPAPAQVIAVKPRRITLRLQSSEMTCADRYRVEYKAANCGRKNIVAAKWRVTEIWRNASDFVFLDVKPETEYQLRYALMDDNSMSDYSSITEFQTLPRARPGQPAVLEQNKDSLTVSWQRPETDGDSPVLQYMVEYMEAGLEGWQSVLTEGPECSVTFPQSTCYKVRVSAVYGEGDTSKPSEETEVLLDAWNIDSSEREACLFLELQTEKKPELRGRSDEDSDVRSFLQCTAQLRWSQETLRQLIAVLFKAQNEELTCCFLRKVDGDLSACSLNWEIIQCFLHNHTVTVSVSIIQLLTVLDRVQLRRLSSSFVLSIIRLLLLRLLYCCSVSDPQQGAAAVLLSTLQHRLDFSCSSSLDLTEHTQTHTLSTEDCRVISMIIQRAHTHTQLLLQDCEIEEAGLEQLFTVLHTVTLHCSKALLSLSLWPEGRWFWNILNSWT